MDLTCGPFSGPPWLPPPPEMPNANATNITTTTPPVPNRLQILI